MKLYFIRHGQPIYDPDSLTPLGEEQAKALEEFYRGDAGCMITLCGTYFSKRLSKLITEAQKK